MNKNEFINYAAKQMKEYLPQDIAKDIEVEPVQIVKMNDQKLNGLRFYKSDDSPQPTIYLDQAYDNFCNGESAEHIFRSIADSYVGATNDQVIPKAPELKYENIKDKLSLRLIEITRNKEFLKNIPYMSVGNGLAMVCDIRISNNGPNGYYSTILNNSLMKGMACNKAEVFKQAIADSWKNSPPVFQSMESTIFGSNKAENLLYDGNHVTEIAPMYVLTNETRVHGAAVLFYPDVQERISEVLGEGYYALPSSVHEFIIVPESAKISEKELSSMVKDANGTVVKPAEVLSDNVYKFDVASKTLAIAVESKSMNDRISERMC